MEPIKAIALSIGGSEAPVITEYQLGLIVHRLHASPRPQGDHQRRTGMDFRREVKRLLDTGILQPHPDCPRKVFTILGRRTDDVNEIACTVDPFCYISHLSAMRHHGLTDRLPAKLFLSSPDNDNWRAKAGEQMKRDLGEDLPKYLDGNMPALERLAMRRIDRIEIRRFNSVHWGTYKNVRGKNVKVATIGRTFRDMLRNPELCGGMDHVLEVWDGEAKTYLKPIIHEVDRNGSPIDKVRAGYLLEEKMGIKSDIVASWVEYAERGGSRKLDPSEEYAPRWSEKWCLSLNI